eukprot:2091849-Prymnesium_polylepis.1
MERKDKTQRGGDAEEAECGATGVGPWQLRRRRSRASSVHLRRQEKDGAADPGGLQGVAAAAADARHGLRRRPLQRAKVDGPRGRDPALPRKRPAAAADRGAGRAAAAGADLGGGGEARQAGGGGGPQEVAQGGGREEGARPAARADGARGEAPRAARVPRGAGGADRDDGGRGEGAAALGDGGPRPEAEGDLGHQAGARERGDRDTVCAAAADGAAD